MGLNDVTCGADTAREERHVCLWHAIGRLDFLIEDLRQLRDRIKGTGDPNVKAPEAPPPPLEALLVEGPDHVRSRIKEAHDLVGQIGASLF